MLGREIQAGGASSAAAEEIRRFDALAAEWWDPDGPMRSLHRMNPLRVGWITDRVRARHPDLAGVRLLDVGCGAGLAAEALARRGLAVLGLDAAGKAIEAAQAHATGQDLPLAYRVGAPEDLREEGRRFTVVTALEVIEHVADPGAFLSALAALLEPGGLLFVSTLNRTARSFLMAKVGAEYVLRWLPVGTHDWRKFIPPVDLAADLRRAGLAVTDIAGMVLDPLTGRWKTSRDLSVNYIVAAGP